MASLALYIHVQFPTQEMLEKVRKELFTVGREGDMGDEKYLVSSVIACIITHDTA